MMVSTDGTAHGSEEARAFTFYRTALEALLRDGVPFLVGGAYSLARYTDIHRDTKDVDIFIHPRDRERTLATLAGTGHQTEVPFPHWLAKARCGD